MHLHGPHIAAWTAVGDSRLAKKRIITILPPPHPPGHGRLNSAAAPPPPPRCMAQPVSQRGQSLYRINHSCPSLLKSPPPPPGLRPPFVLMCMPNSAPTRMRIRGRIIFLQSVRAVPTCAPSSSRSSSLGRSARCAFGGAWHHNTFSADRRFNGGQFNQVCFLRGPPLPRAPVGGRRR